MNKTGNQIEREVEFLLMDQICQKQQYEPYLKLLGHSGLKVDQQIFVRNVKISPEDSMHQIYTENRQKDLPHIVMLHGYGATAMSYFRMFKQISQQYQLHALDHLGMGFSSLGDLEEDMNEQQAVDYFVEAIESWRKKIRLDKFTLVGHSFGGYISTAYATRYPSGIQRLVLLSPAGATLQSQEERNQIHKNRWFFTKAYHYVADKLYSIGFTPSGVIRPPIVRTITLATTNYVFKTKGQQKRLNSDYLTAMTLRREKTSEILFYKIFKYYVRPAVSIEEMLLKAGLECGVEFYFGATDWMDTKGAKRLAESFQKISFELIEKSGHQLLYDNPEQVALKILNPARQRRQKFK